MKLNGYIGTIADADGYLYQNGKTEYKILIPADASEAEKFAASELSDIFSKAGVQMETVTDEGLVANRGKKYISLGNTVYFKALGIKLLQKEFKFDGFIIENVGNTYVIKGVGDTGTCFGAYGFAEYAMGYVFYAPDEYKVCDEAKNKEFHIKDIPTFFGRNAYSYDTLVDVDYSFRLRINGEFSERHKKHGEGTPWSSLHDQSLALQILDHKKYRKDHPDWYYLNPANEGLKTSRGNPQICFSKVMYDEEVFKLFMDTLINDYIIPEKDKMFFMLGISDSHDFCPCKTCQEEVKKYTKSGVSVRFTNKVADEVEKWRLKNAPEREIYLISFAYYETFDPPVIKKGGKYVPIDESVITRDNVVIQFAPIDATYLYELMDPVHNASSREALLGWKAVAKHMFVWDYRQDFVTQTFFYPTTVTAQANNDTYVKMGMMEVFNQAQPFCAGSPFMFMDNFARARLHWNAKENYRELIAEFNQAYYKDAAPFVEQYLHALEDYYSVMVSRGWNTIRNDGAALHKEYYTVEEMHKFKEILDKALAAADAMPNPKIAKKVRERVEVLTLFYKFVLVLCFPLDIPQSEALELIADLRIKTKTTGLTLFMRRISADEYLDDAENIVLGKIDIAKRKYSLKEAMKHRL